MSDKFKHFGTEAPAGWDSRQAAGRASFLQSSSWGNFQQALGSQVHYADGSGWSCLLIKKNTPLGSYFFAPYGPTLESAAKLKPAISALKDYGRVQGIDWLRLEPMVGGSSSAALKNSLPALGGKPAAHNREPVVTRIIDLTPAPDQLLASISQSTRSFIRKNQRENFLSFKSSTRPEDISLFIEMLGHVTRRSSVFFFPPAYFKQQAELLMPAGMLRLELAMQNDKPIASALFHDFGEQSSYTFAASLPEARKTSASALLLWQAMLNARQRGLKKMDLFGIAAADAPAGDPWQGFTAFKSKFGGQVAAYSGTWDFPLSRRYRLYRGARRLRPRRRAS